MVKGNSFKNVVVFYVVFACRDKIIIQFADNIACVYGLAKKRGKE
jgi:hypothetical protein